MSTTEQVRHLIASALTDPHVVLDALEVTAAGKRKVVRITLDRLAERDATGWSTEATAPLTLDEIAEHSRAISDRLDEQEPFGGAAYVLEVSSPGIGRPLAHPRAYRRNVGRLLTLTAAGTSHTGRIVKASDEAVVLELPGADGEESSQQSFAYEDIDRASVEVEFSRTEEGND